VFSLLSSLLAFQMIFGMELIVFLVLIFLLPLILFVFVAVWMYGDANSRGMGGGIWVLLLILASLLGSFIGGLIVLIVYLVVREGHPVGGRPYGYGYGYPPPAYGYPPSGYGSPAYPPPTYPAAPPPAASGRCPRCGAATNPGARFCASCGSPL
jgi:hypothetical protein